MQASQTARRTPWIFSFALGAALIFAVDAGGIDLTDDEVTAATLEGITPEAWISDVAKRDFESVERGLRLNIVSELLLLLRGGDDARREQVMGIIDRAVFPDAGADLLGDIDRRVKEIKAGVAPEALRRRDVEITTRLCLNLDGVGGTDMAQKILVDLWRHEAASTGSTFVLAALARLGDERHAEIFEAATRSNKVEIQREGWRGLFKIDSARCFIGPEFGDEVQSFVMRAPTSTWVQSWADVGGLEIDVAWPADAPAPAQLMVHVQDWDFLWYQNLLPGTIQPGRERRFRADFSAESSAWQPLGHHATWHLRALVAPREVGIHFVCKADYTGTGRVERVQVIGRDDNSVPTIRNVRSSSDSVACYEMFELTFDVPDRYANPFDTNEVWVTGEFEMPDGKTKRMDGFYARRFFRKVTSAGERISPQGAPYWSVRFAPLVAGTHTVRLRIRDRNGETTWGPATFEATPAESPGFVRVSSRDRRYLEFTDGTPYTPIGHNIRSPFDARTDERFPWMQRWPEGSAIYERFFRKMSTHGENMAEIWAAAWSLGLEWSDRHPWYHGLGQYNMQHAWEMDQVIAAAEENGIYLNVVILNHGRFSDYVDPEWDHNPYNVKIGGYLNTPQEFFASERARRDFLQLMRYMIARWGYSPNVFAWELWNELDLTGVQSIAKHANQNRPEVVDWHREVSSAVKKLDPYDHMITTHVSGDYSRQNKTLIEMPGIDLSAVDAYYMAKNPLQIVTLLMKTAEFNNPLGKPVLVTEFGGSHMAESLEHLDVSLHAGLWASTAIPVAGTPLFWWWLTIDEEHFYPKYLAVQNFMKDEDRRDPEMILKTAQVLHGAAVSAGYSVLSLQSRHRAMGWLWNHVAYADLKPGGEPTDTNLSIRFSDIEPGEYDLEFWDTLYGRVIGQTRVGSPNGVLTAPIPPFTRDIAFKLRPR
ncbi:MAG: DUF5060 domain-containing protein [Verrucomicrobia bacterium]|nr:DUF5060 domain-containing protein [Verrucomicrobiota bacterium]MDA1086486.1 DUF5060 domain-containing protein [Verrucomicrobiota bacterium]